LKIFALKLVNARLRLANDKNKCARVKLERRAYSLVICQTVAGVLGFVTTLAFSLFVTFIQQNSNKVFELTVYSQQILSLLSIMVVVVAILYVHFVLIKNIHTICNVIFYVLK